MQKVFESSDKPPVKRSRVKRCSVRTDSKGKPRVQEFDSRQSLQEDEFVEVEPLVDFVEIDDVLVVLVALSGVKKDDIDLRVTESCLTVSVDAADFEWCDELRLPAKVKPNSAWASYRNGVLEVRLEKLKIVRDGRISVKK
jgi:HSP20 family protein